MDFDLSEQQQAFVDTAREFATRVLRPGAGHWDENCVFPIDVLRQAGELGFCSIYTPEEYGGLGLGRLDASLIFEHLAAGCTATTAFLTIHNMVLWMIATFGNDATRERFCPQLTTGKALASYCLTEPEAGSDAASLRTTATVSGDEYVLNGTKAFISGAGQTDVLVVMARLVDARAKTHSGAAGICSLAVPAKAEGISYGAPEKKMGWNSHPTALVHFSDVRVPRAYRLGAEGQGFRIAMQGLDGGRINIASCSVGTAQAALEETLRYVQERRQFDRPLADFQGLQFRLADMATELVAARQMVRLAACRLDQGHPEASACCAMAKRLATDTGFTVCNQALQLHGGYGYTREYPLERYVRDTRVHQILEGTNEIMRIIIARRLLQAGAAGMG